jgi:hypothetical protein
MRSMEEARARRARVAALAAIALAAPIVLALLLVEPLGFQDLPQHLSVARLAATAPELLPPDVEQVAVPLWQPYRALYALLGLLGPTHVLVMGRLLVALYVLGTAIALVRLVLVFEQGDPRLALAGAPLAGSLMLWSGFLNYQLAMPVLLFLIAELATLVERRREGPLRRPLATALACVVLLYLLHPLVLSLAAALAVVAVALAWDGERRRVALLATPALLALALAAVAMGLTVSLSHPSERGLVAEVFGQLSFEEVFRRLKLVLRNAWVSYEVDRHNPTLRGTVAWLGALVAVAGLAVVARPRRAIGRHGLLVVIAFAACLGAALVLPHKVGDLGYAGARFGLPALLFLTALAAGPFATEAGKRVAIPLVVAGCATLSLGTTEALVAVGNELAPVARIARTLAREPRVPRVLPLCLHRRTSVVTNGFEVAVSAHDYVNVATGGSNPYLFDNPFLPIRLKANRLAGPGLFDPLGYDGAKHGAGATHLLVRLGSSNRKQQEPDPMALALVAEIARTHDLVLQDGDWLLFAAREGR